MGFILRTAAVAFGFTLAMNSLLAAEPAYLIGRAMEDITGPPVGVQMLGFVRADQISTGVHTRQWSRAIAIAEIKGPGRVALVVTDLAFPTHALKLAVVDRVKKDLGELYHYDNIVLSGTHTHGAPGEYHQALASSPIGGRFCEPYFDALVEGIGTSIIKAHRNLQPGNIYFAQGEVNDAGANRSMPAYLMNPAEERAQYPSDTDKTMTLLSLVGKDGPIASINWFAVHPTSMTYFNKLISGDNKVVGSMLIEADHHATYHDPNDYVALFAQTNCGDVTPNLNLNNTGPGKTDTESTRIIGERQAEVARKLLEQAKEAIQGPIETKQSFVDFSRLIVSGEFTGEGDQPTFPSAFGYSFAAGSGEDGGGHPLFREGMKEQNPLIDGIVRAGVRPPEPSPDFRAGHRPKVILFAPGLYRPPMQEQVLPLGLVRIGSIALVVGPAEYTTMSGRRIRKAVAAELGIDPSHVIIAGYSNDFAGYVTTHEEYQSQQYEGGHTLFGPWTEAGHRQEFVKLARALKQKETIPPSVTPVDWRGKATNTWQEGPDENSPAHANVGDVVTPPAPNYRAGERAEVVFWTGNPSNDYRRSDHYMAVERKVGGAWKQVVDDGAWATTIEWKQTALPANPGKESDPKLEGFKLSPAARELRPEPFQATLRWNIPAGTEAGTYRFTHLAKFKSQGKVERKEAYSPSFEVIP
ncbi:neutral/alkaline ceramidase [bacterium]|nr:neutral/alkaline ceramidase [bacterium]